MAGTKPKVQEGLTLGTPWPEIRALAETGIKLTSIAKAYHIDISTISHRKKLEGWATPKEVSERARQLLAEEMGDPDSTNPLLDRRARELIERHLSLRETVHSAAMEAATSFKATKRVPSTFFELESLMRTADKAAGIDTGNSNGSHGGSASNPSQGSRTAINITFLNPPANQPHPGPLIDLPPNPPHP